MCDLIWKLVEEHDEQHGSCAEGHFSNPCKDRSALYSRSCSKGVAVVCCCLGPCSLLGVAGTQSLADVAYISPQFRTSLEDHAILSVPVNSVEASCATESRSTFLSNFISFYFLGVISPLSVMH